MNGRVEGKSATGSKASSVSDWQPQALRRSFRREMSVSLTIDTSKSLAELSRADWGLAPADAGTLVRERHEMRRTPIRDLPDGALVRFLDMGSDAEILIPVALERLRDDPDAVDLLCAALRAEHFNWCAHPELVAVVRDRVSAVTSEIGQITSDLERFHLEAEVWRLYAKFERRLSTTDDELKTFTGEEIIAVAVRHKNGRINYFLTLGKFYWQAELDEIARRVFRRCAAYALDGEPECAEVCRSLLDASQEPFFYEHFFALCQMRLPDYRRDERESCERRARQIHEQIVNGGLLFYCGSHRDRKRDGKRYWSYGPRFVGRERREEKADDSDLIREA